MHHKKNIRRISQGGDFNGLLKKLEEKWLTIYLNKEQHLPYCKLVNKKEIL